MFSVKQHFSQYNNNNEDNLKQHEQQKNINTASPHLLNSFLLKKINTRAFVQ